MNPVRMKAGWGCEEKENLAAAILVSPKGEQVKIP